MFNVLKGYFMDFMYYNYLYKKNDNTLELAYNFMIDKINDNLVSKV